MGNYITFVLDCLLNLAIFHPFLRVIHHWAIETPIHRAVDLLGISETHIIEWFARMRDICVWYNSANPLTVGGPGLVVEIDEAAINKRIPHVG